MQRILLPTIAGESKFLMSSITSLTLASDGLFNTNPKDPSALFSHRRIMVRSKFGSGRKGSEISSFPFSGLTLFLYLKKSISNPRNSHICKTPNHELKFNTSSEMVKKN